MLRNVLVFNPLVNLRQKYAPDEMTQRRPARERDKLGGHRRENDDSHHTARASF
jgi:hypothetical protein